MGNSTIRHEYPILKNAVAGDCSNHYRQHADPIRTTIE